MNLKSILPRKNILSLDIGSYQIKGVVGKETNKGIIIADYFTILTPEGTYSNGKIVDKDLIYYVIYEELKKNKIKVKDTYLTINSSEIIAREVIIPKVEWGEIEKVLSFQIEDYIPTNPENYIIQFKVIGSIFEDNVEKLSILLIGVPKEIVDSHFQLLRNINLNPLVLDYQPNVTGKLIKYNNLINNEYLTEDITFAIIDIGYECTKVSIIKNEIVYVTRVIDIGGKDIDKRILNGFNHTKAHIEELKQNLGDINKLEHENSDNMSVSNIIKDTFDVLNKRIELIFRYFLTRELGNEIQMILLHGGNGNFEGLDSFYSNYFNIPSIKIELLDNVYFDGKVYEYINCIGTLIRRAGK